MNISQRYFARLCQCTRIFCLKTANSLEFISSFVYNIYLSMIPPTPRPLPSSRIFLLLNKPQFSAENSARAQAAGHADSPKWNWGLWVKESFTCCTILKNSFRASPQRQFFSSNVIMTPFMSAIIGKGCNVLFIQATMHFDICTFKRGNDRFQKILTSLNNVVLSSYFDRILTNFEIRKFNDQTFAFIATIPSG